MIAFVEGVIEEKQPTRLVLNVAGVGYEILVPLSSYDRLPETGRHCRVLTYDYVRDDTHQLFGFVTEEERGMFVLLMATSGVGPKLALGALSGMSVRELRAAVIEGDVRRLSSISGVGRKTAERLIVELRDRISQGEALDALSRGGSGEAEGKLRDAALALAALGYQPDAARKMASDAIRRHGDAELSLEDLIRRALGSS